MKHLTSVLGVTVCAFALASTAAIAQGKGQGGGQRQQVDRPVDRSLDRDIQRDRDRVDQATQKKDQIKDQDRDQAQQHAQQKSPAGDQQQQRAQAQDQKVYGHEFMSVQERNEYREQLRMIDSDEERGKFVAEHREEMQLRAKAQGKIISDTETEEAE